MLHNITCDYKGFKKYDDLIGVELTMVYRGNIFVVTFVIIHLKFGQTVIPSLSVNSFGLVKETLIFSAPSGQAERNDVKVFVQPHPLEP